MLAAADSLRANVQSILKANEIDMANGKDQGLSNAMMDRLKLTEERVADMANAVVSIAEMDDPVGQVMARWERPNGLDISRIRTPLGVIGVIYESRPNVTADAGSLCLKAGNAVILRGGTDSFNSSRAIHGCMVDGLKSAGLPEAAIQLVPITDRAAVGEMLKGLERQNRCHRSPRWTWSGGAGAKRCPGTGICPSGGTGPCLCRQIGQS